MEKGQALLIVVLIMVVVLTVGLSVASRSITNLRITNDDENSQRAFSAAEAGVESALKSECTIETCSFAGDFTENQSVFRTTVTPIVGTQFIVRGGVQIRQDEGADVLLSDYSADPTQAYTTNKWSGTVTVYWGETDPCTDAAVEILVLHGVDKDDPQLNRYVYDPCDARRETGPTPNNFTEPGGAGSVNSKDFPYSASITIAPGSPGLLMRVVPLYANAVIGIKCTSPGCGAFPVQGKQIESIGESGEADGRTQRKISFVQSYASIPSEFFQYVLMSPQ